MAECVLIVEDDESILAGLRLNLEMEGYRVFTAMDGYEAVTKFQSVRPDLVILDVMLPEMNGFEVLESIRKCDPEVSVMILSARDGPDDKVTGLGLGADDYLCKPFHLAELLARIDARLRRKRLQSGDNADRTTFGEVTIDLLARQVTRGDAPVDMTAREYDLLVYLVRRPGRVVTREQIVEHVWGDDYEGTPRTVDNFIARLRTKIEADPDSPRYIQTVRGVGYRFAP